MLFRSKDHKRILFNGNGYDNSWIEEAERRGLCNYRTTPDCMPHLLDKKNVTMLTSHKVFTEKELESRCEIMLDNYCKTVVIEANTMSDMVRKQILPAVEKYLGEISETALTKQQVAPNASSVYEKETITKLSALTEQIFVACKDLENAVIRLAESKNTIEESYAIRDTVLGKMSALRAAVDEAETLTDETYWPFPSYCDLLFGVR